MSLGYACEDVELSWGDHDAFIARYGISLGLTNPPYLIWEDPYTEEEDPYNIWVFGDYVYNDLFSSIVKKGYALFSAVEIEEE